MGIIKSAYNSKVWKGVRKVTGDRYGRYNSKSKSLGYNIPKIVSDVKALGTMINAVKNLTTLSFRCISSPIVIRILCLNISIYPCEISFLDPCVKDKSLTGFLFNRVRAPRRCAGACSASLRNFASLRSCRPSASLYFI